jgi:hypothetical protein
LMALDREKNPQWIDMTKPFRHRRGDYTTCQTNKGGWKRYIEVQREEKKRRE